jgi:hypothetical protein
VFGSIFVYETLAKTALDLGADWLGIYDINGYNLLPHRPEPSDPWTAQQISDAYSFLVQTRPPVGAHLMGRPLSLLQLRAARILVVVVPGAYVIAHMGGLQNWASDALARKLADAIETWVAESQNPYFPRRPSWLPPLPRFQPDLSRFRNDLSRFRPGP